MAGKEGPPRAASEEERIALEVLDDIVIVADNMRVPEPDPRYVEAVTSDPKLETLFLNMQRSGIGVTLKKHRTG